MICCCCVAAAAAAAAVVVDAAAAVVAAVAVVVVVVAIMFHFFLHFISIPPTLSYTLHFPSRARAVCSAGWFVLHQRHLAPPASHQGPHLSAIFARFKRAASQHPRASAPLAPHSLPPPGSLLSFAPVKSVLGSSRQYEAIRALTI